MNSNNPSHYHQTHYGTPGIPNNVAAQHQIYSLHHQHSPQHLAPVYTIWANVRKISVFLFISVAFFWFQVYYPTKITLKEYGSTTSHNNKYSPKLKPQEQPVKIVHSTSQYDPGSANFIVRRKNRSEHARNINKLIRPTQSDSAEINHISTEETKNNKIKKVETAFKINERAIFPAMFWGPGSYGGHLMKPLLFNKDCMKEEVEYGTKLVGNVQLPGYKQGWDPRLGLQGDSANLIPGDLAVLFNIPFSGSSIALDVMRSCHRLLTTMTGEKGLRTIPNESVQKLQVIFPGASPPNSYEPLGYANIDVSTLPGIDRAKELGLVSSGFDGVIVTPYIYQTDHLFYGTNVRGRLFSIFRDPMERAADLFYYMKYASWETIYDPELMTMSINQYAQSPLLENNWMTRKLANVPNDQEITQEHLQIALEVMRTRMIVGLYESLDESLDRFDRYFGWKFEIKPNSQELCRQRFLSRGILNSNPNKKPLEEGTEAYEQFFWQNQFDLEIYDYAKNLFAEQGQFVEGTPKNFRLN